jgi:hypothetical protein
MKPKKLSLREIHQLYLLLVDYLPEKEQGSFLDELISVFDKAKPGTIAECLNILYPKYVIQDSLESIAMFIEGLNQNDFFGYANFLSGIKRARRNH